jgi:hypothetical protein
MFTEGPVGRRILLREHAQEPDEWVLAGLRRAELVALLLVVAAAGATLVLWFFRLWCKPREGGIVAGMGVCGARVTGDAERR